MNPPPRQFHRLRLAATLLTVIVTALALGSIGCESSPSASDNQPLPTLADLRSPQTPGPANTASRHESEAAPVFVVQRIDLRLDAPVQTAWELAETAALPATTVAAWRANGLRVGLVPRSNWEIFATRLPAALGMQQQLYRASEQPTALQSTLRLRNPVAVDLTVPPRPPKELDLVGGQLHLLAQADYTGPGWLRLTLTPHHHLERASLTPRTAQEKLLDGRLLDELSLRILLSDDHLLVIGLEIPEPIAPLPPADGADIEGPDAAQALTGRQSASGQRSRDDATLMRAPAATGQADSPRDDQDGASAQTDAEDVGNAGADTGEEAAEPQEPMPEPLISLAERLDPHLGRALFTATRGNQPIQMLLLIRPVTLHGHD